MMKAMISNNRIMPTSLYLYWCKKCTPFMECSKFLNNKTSGGEQQKSDKTSTKQSDKEKQKDHKKASDESSGGKARK